MKAALDSGIKVQLHGFGKFERKNVQLPAMTWLPPESQSHAVSTIRFTPSIVLEEKINVGLS